MLFEIQLSFTEKLKSYWLVLNSMWSHSNRCFECFHCHWRFDGCLLVQIRVLRQECPCVWRSRHEDCVKESWEEVRHFLGSRCTREWVLMHWSSAVLEMVAVMALHNVKSIQLQVWSWYWVSTVVSFFRHSLSSAWPDWWMLLRLPWSFFSIKVTTCSFHFLKYTN